MTMQAEASGPSAPGFEDDDHALALAAGRGDRAAFARLIARHYDTMYRMAWRWCGDASEAEDIAQDVSVKLARTIGSWRGDGGFSTWLFRIVLNAVRDRQRAKAAEQRRVAAYAVQALVDAQISPADDDPGQRLWAAVATLPERQRDAVLLVHGEGLGHGEAADVMGVSEGTVSFQIHEAKKNLRVMMQTGEGEQP